MRRGVYMWPGIIEKYKALLSVSAKTPRITLHEGNTPLIPLVNIGREMPGLDLYVKYEGANPTGSFKDRGMTLAVSKAVEEGAKAVICASTGNTSASAAAYAARAGLDCLVLIPQGKVALGKLAQAMHYGARILALQGNFDQALAMARELAGEYPLILVNSLNPYRILGQQTAAWEVTEQLGQVPDYLAIPVGNAGNITAYWKGFQSAAAAGKASSVPRMMGFEAEGSAAIVKGYPIAQPETVATAIRIGNPANWQGAVEAADQSGGLIDFVSDEEILAAYRLLARAEGIFCEPASAASLAGVKKLYGLGYFTAPAKVVCVLTGNGLKDPDTAMVGLPQPQVVRADRAEILQVLGGL